MVPGQMLVWVFLLQQTAFVTSIGCCSPTPTFSFKLFAAGRLIKALLLLEWSAVCMNCLFSSELPQILDLCKGSFEQRVQGALCV